MSINLYQLTVPVFTHHLKNLQAILKTAAKDAKLRGIDPAVILNARLAPDMMPLVNQVRIASDHAKGCSARLAGIDPPVLADNETTFAELDQRLKTVLSFLRTLKPAQFVESETRRMEVKMPIGNLEFIGMDYVNGWAMPNFYFHYTTAYSILRSNGVAIGKRDFLGMVPGMTATGKLGKMMGLNKPAKKAAKKPAKKK